ncbi:MAG: iron-containing alcohol dehydrogenase [Treponema sp.]|nr:iron-containing alcohol dehydrogenase [Treponema sp.]
MNPVKKIYCRCFQFAFRVAIPLMPYRKPQIFSTFSDCVTELKSLGITSLLLVTDSFLRKSGVTAGLEALLQESGIACHVYDGTKPNPTVQNVEESTAMYRANGCQALIAFGGGSSMDCAKATGACVVYPKKKLAQMRGLLRVLRKLPPLVAIPTTAGTGSETTVTAVITDPVEKHKYTMNNFTMIPRYAVLAPEVTYSLPAHLTSTTGMDALAHAVEAYIGGSTTKETRQMALDATRLIFGNIKAAYDDGNNHAAREAMLEAAFKAGVAFTQSYVGYVHAVAHTLGGQYGIPHGLANSVLMPVVLEKYGSAVYKKLHDMAVAGGICLDSDSDEVAAKKFIQAIRDLNKYMNIPESFDAIREEDIPHMVSYAEKEANPLYPVPVLMDKEELEYFYRAVMSKS